MKNMKIIKYAICAGAVATFSFGIYILCFKKSSKSQQEQGVKTEKENSQEKVVAEIKENIAENPDTASIGATSPTATIQDNTIHIPQARVVSLIMQLTRGVDIKQLSQEQIQKLYQQTCQLIAKQLIAKKNFDHLPKKEQVAIQERLSLETDEIIRRAMDQQAKLNLLKEDLSKDVEALKKELMTDKQCTLQIIYVGGPQGQSHAEHIKNGAKNAAQQGSDVIEYFARFKNSTNEDYHYKVSTLSTSRLVEFMNSFQGHEDKIKYFLEQSKEGKSGAVIMLKKEKRGNTEYAVIHLAQVSATKAEDLKNMEEDLKAQAAQRRYNDNMENEMKKYEIVVK